MEFHSNNTSEYNNKTQQDCDTKIRIFHDENLQNSIKNGKEIHPQTSVGSSAHKRSSGYSNFNLNFELENDKVDKLLLYFTDKIDEDLNKSKRHSKFNKKFLKLRENLKLEKVSRKSQFDSLLKKTKAKVFKTIHESMKKCLVTSYKLNRLPQSFITNIKIEFNKIYLNKSIIEIYKENEIVESLEELFIKQYVKEEKQQIFVKFVRLTVSEVYEYYITSQQYIKDRKRIRAKEGDKFAVLFSFIAHNFIQYYQMSKGNRPKSNVPKSRIGMDTPHQNGHNSNIEISLNGNNENSLDKKNIFRVMN
jgi:hypothetical protein